MEFGALFLKSILTGIITFSELDWVTIHQSNFKSLERSIAISLRTMLDADYINEVPRRKKLFFREKIYSLNIFLF